MSPSLYHSAIAVNIAGEPVSQKKFREHSELTVVKPDCASADTQHHGQN
jgi:hypothetical protein